MCQATGLHMLGTHDRAGGEVRVTVANAQAFAAWYCPPLLVCVLITELSPWRALCST